MIALNNKISLNQISFPWKSCLEQGKLNGGSPSKPERVVHELGQAGPNLLQSIIGLIVRTMHNPFAKVFMNDDPLRIHGPMIRPFKSWARNLSPCPVLQA